MSYELYRKAPASDRDWRALRYLDLAEPLLASDRRRASTGDKDAARLVSVRARRIAEVSLGTSVPDVARAERALDVLMSLINAGLVEPSGVLLAEIDFRRAQIALERGDGATAEEIVERLAQEDSKYAAAGRRMVYRHALNTWRRLERGDPQGADTLDAARLVVKHGRVLVEELASTPKDMSDPAVASLSVSVGDAAADLALYADDRESGELALDLYRRVLAVHPATGATLHRMAEVAEKLGKHELALDAWRRLLAGLQDGSDDWFEAKYHQVALLMDLDVGRARDVLEQLAVLYPNFGPKPWSDKLRAMYDELTRGAGAGGGP
jgi:tetratricopeptide (TPR) repeat protein